MWKKLIIAVIVIFFFGGAGALSYRVIKSQGVAEEWTVHPEVEHPRLLIATQKSAFKDMIVKKAVQNLGGEKIRISVADVSSLSHIESSYWDGIVVFTTIESGQFPPSVHEFLAKDQNRSQRVGLIYTADSGEWKNKDLDVDGKASASVKENTDLCVQMLIQECRKVLELQ